MKNYSGIGGVETGAVKKINIIARGAMIHVDIVPQNDVITATTLKVAI